MKEKKYIDRLYQEKFRDFEAAPREAVWKSIEAKLQEKKKRRAVVPLWYRYAGVAALLAFLLMLGDWILPAQSSSAVANEETEETLQPATSPVIARPTSTEVLIPSEATTAIVNNARPDKGLNTTSTKVITLNTDRKEQRSTEETASQIGSKKAIFEIPVAVAELPLQKEKQNSIPEDLKPSIFDALKTSEETEIALNQSENYFEVSTHATPIYYGKMGNSNPLDVGINDHREAEVTYSYGVKLALNLTNKVKIRSGVSRVDLSYSASGNGYRSASGVYLVRNVSMNKVNGQEIKMVTGTFNNRTRSSANRTPSGIFTQGNLNQKMGYIEVPVELEINLFKRNFELNLIGGGSTLFLQENEVILYSGNTSAAGKADNLSDLSFSANLGLGLDYNLSEKFKLNLEPMFKYQIRTFETPTGDVQPYFLGVYTGFSYKF
ncbi:hypothetical protein [Salinimicrobium terrae]|uniref:hypothetical protein n=1 Tax=Salinimicrobium terrae TaxID=470866 RepID=UPI00041472B9|nr:hypothetical protein [Salinimicrobium terrae]